VTEEPNFPVGFKVIHSDLVKADEMFLFNPASLELRWEPDDPYAPLKPDPFKTLTTHMRVAGKKTVVESNPLDWARPRGLRAWLRRLRAIMGYSYREAAGTLRYYEHIDAVKIVGFSV
jgi:hypothetical protein